MAASLWFIYAIISAILWGISYSFSEKLMQSGVSVPLLLAVEALLMIPLLLIIGFKTNPLEGLNLVFSDYNVFVLTAFVAITAVLGNMFILMSVSEKNATLATLIEITYPLFTCFFAWLFFREMQLNWATAGGAVLVLVGVSIIYLKG